MKAYPYQYLILDEIVRYFQTGNNSKENNVEPVTDYWEDSYPKGKTDLAKRRYLVIATPSRWNRQMKSGGEAICSSLEIATSRQGVKECRDSQ